MHGRFVPFAGALMLGASAFAAHGAAAQDTIGVTAAVNPQATGEPPARQRRELRVGINVVANERIVTSAEGRAQMLFRDESAFTVGPNSDVVLDEFVFDPETETGKLALSATKGVFRFVGGKISKKTPVTLKTPNSVIGIRGGIVLVSVQPNGATRATFLFGESMTVESGGVVKRVTRPGFTISAESPDSPPSDPEPASTADLDAALTALEGGGASEEKEDDSGAEDATQSASTTEEEDDGGDDGASDGEDGDGGSSDGEEGDGGSADDGSAEGDDTGSSEEDGGETQTAADDGGDGTTSDATSDPATSDVPTDEDVASSDLSALGSDSEPDAIAPVTGTTFEVALADTTSSDTTEEVVADANVTDTTQNSAVDSIGFAIDATFSGRIKRGSSAAGGSDDGVASSNLAFAGATIRNGAFDTAAGGSRYTINAALGTFAATSTSNPFGAGTLSGTGILRADNEFITYGLTDSDSGQRAFAFAGVPTTTFPTTGATFYRLRKDFIMGSLFPFVSAASTGTATRVLSKTNAAIYWDDSASATAQRPFGGMAIGVAGTAPTQDSVVSVFIGRVTTVGGNTVVVGKMRGSSVAGGTLHAISGTFDTALDANGVGFFGGASPDHLVLQATPGTTIGDQTNATTTTYNPNVVADALGDTLLTRTTQSAPNGTAMNGFATGFVFTEGGSQTSDFLVNFGGDPINISVETSAETNKVLATFDTKTATGAIRFTVGFGDLDISAFGNGLNTTGNSGFFDDGAMVASDRSFGESQVGGTAVTSEAIYMFSVDDRPEDTPSGVSPCTCKFLEWGFWGGQLDTASTNERIHLATWVAGQMTDFTTIAGLTGSATYNGHVTGSVLNGGNSYLATGGFSMTVDFGAPSASTVSVTNFDGGGFSGTGLALSAAPDSGLATFANLGTLTGSGAHAGRSADILGGFVAGGGDPAAEVGGRFTATGTGYEATGIIAAAK